jgi:hypothetical protein
MFPNNATVLEGSLVQIRNNTLQVNTTYEFDLYVTSTDGREGSTSAIIIPTDAIIEVSIVGVIKDANVLNKLTLTGDLYATVGILGTWSVSFEGESVAVVSRSDDSVKFTADEASTSLLFPYTIEGGILVGSRTYTFTLTSCEIALSISCAFAQVDVTMRSPPVGGSVTVSPKRGSALSTIFSYSSIGWLSDEDDSYPLVYRSEITIFLTHLLIQL